jgi:DNA ligase-1
MIEGVAAAAGAAYGSRRRAAKIGGGIVAVAANALTHGAKGLGEYAIALFQPVARCSRNRRTTSSMRWRGSRWPRLEWKIDGARVQVHKSGDDVRIFTANRQRRDGGRARDRVRGPPGEPRVR